MARILVADDELGIRMALKALLENHGHQVETVESGQDAIRAYKNFEPELIFMDISMPGLNGITATKRIIAQNPKAKIVILTAVAHREMVLKAMAEGAKHYIVKPFDHTTILQVAEKFNISSIAP